MSGYVALGTSDSFSTRRGRARYPAKKNPTTLRTQVPPDWARLIRKLRWIGLKEEAKRLEMALGTVPAGEQTALAGQSHHKSPYPPL